MTRPRRGKRVVSKVTLKPSSSSTFPKGRSVAVRKSSRGRNALTELAEHIRQGRRVLIVTGAGLSVPSGVRPFRSTQTCARRSAPSSDGRTEAPTAVWDDVVWQTATRKAFLQHPLQWYNEFWIPLFGTNTHTQATTTLTTCTTTTNTSSTAVSTSNKRTVKTPTYQPNAGHRALERLQQCFPHVTQITQNIDGLQTTHARLIEAHGQLGIYKCTGHLHEHSKNTSRNRRSSNSSSNRRRRTAPTRKSVDGSRHQNGHHDSTCSPLGDNDDDDDGEDDDDDDEDNGDDDDDERSVQLGQRQRQTRPCPYQYRKSLQAFQLEPKAARQVLWSSSTSRPATTSLSYSPKRPPMTLPCPPTCPHCDSFVLPQALLFDEEYHSHQHYQFERMEYWIRNAEVMVFCGTSFAVRLTQVCLERCRQKELPVYNMNVYDTLRPTAQLHVSNIRGSTEDLLPALVELCLSPPHTDTLEKGEALSTKL